MCVCVSRSIVWGFFQEKNIKITFFKIVKKKYFNIGIKSKLVFNISNININKETKSVVYYEQIVENVLCEINDQQGWAWEIYI